MIGSLGFRLLIAAAALLPGVASVVCASQQAEGFIEAPPVFIVSEPDIPLAGMGVEMPRPGTFLPSVGITTVESDEFRSEGEQVQPDLNVKLSTYRIGGLYAFDERWAAGLSVLWRRTRVRGAIGGFPAGGSVTALGDTALVGKRVLARRADGGIAVATLGIELPTGKDDATFDESNQVTNAYYSGFPRRMPISWQPGSGSVDGFLAVSYGRKQRRLSYVGMLVTKLHTSGDEDAKIGDIFIASMTGTYGINRWLAGSLGLTLRTQADDSYPQAPPPGVDQPALAGTTENGTTLYIDPSIRVNIAERLTLGLGARIPIIRPNDGLVPRTQFSLIFYPSL